MSNRKIKILFILPSLKAGGAERVIAFLSKNLNKQQFKCSLIVIGRVDDAVYSTEGIEVIYLNKKRVLNAIPKIINHLIFNRQEIVVGSISHVNKVIAMLSFIFPKTKFIGREASVSSIMETFTTTNRKLHFPFFKNYYNYLDAIICQSTDMAHDLVKYHAINKNKIYIINNPISGYLPIRERNLFKNKVKELITVGRLSKEKGHERILKVLSKLDFDFCYTIIGTGKEKDYLFKLAEKLNILYKIKHIPYTKDIAYHLSKSDVFIQGSYVEGFPNALLESCVIGTPAIAFAAPGGTKEIIEKDVNGFIVSNDTEFIEKINYILYKKKWDPKQINASVVKKYNKEVILKKYEDLFLKLTTEKNL